MIMMINSYHIYVNSTFNAAVASHNFPVFRLSHESHDLHVSYILVPLSMILPAVYAAVMFRNKFTTLTAGVIPLTVTTCSSMTQGHDEPV